MAVVVIIDGKRQGKKKGNKKKERIVPLLWAKGSRRDPNPRAPKEIYAGGKPTSCLRQRGQRAFKRLPANRQEPKGALD